jgi:hypothetical protein
MGTGVRSNANTFKLKFNTYVANFGCGKVKTPVIMHMYADLKKMFELLKYNRKCGLIKL